MAREFYVSRDGQERHGPHTGIELREMADRGELRPTDLVWKEGMPKPVAASKVKGLFNLDRTPSAARGDKSTQIPTAANPGTPIRDCGIDLKVLGPSNGVGDTPQGHRDSPPYRPTSTTGHRTPTTQTEPTATETGGSEVTVRAFFPFSTIKPSPSHWWQDPSRLAATGIATGLLLFFCFIAFAVYVAGGPSTRELQDRVHTLTREADQLTASGKKREALQKYTELLTLMGSTSPGEELQGDIAQARRASDTLQAEFKAEDELQRKREEAERTAQEEKRKAEGEAERLRSENHATRPGAARKRG